MLVIGHILLAWWRAIRQGAKARHQQQPVYPSPGKWPFVSVIVPAWCEREMIECCIKSLRTVDYPKWEIVIIAGGSDGTLEIAHTACKGDSHFRILEQLPHGKNAALNLGLQSARGETIVILDADTRVTPGWLKSLVIPLTNGTSISTGNYFAMRRTSVSQCGEMEKIFAYEVCGATTLQGSGSIALQRHVLETIGGFPEDVVVGVDWDLNTLIAMHGFHSVFCQDAIVHTERPATLSEFLKNEIRWRRAHIWLLWHRRNWFFRDVMNGLGHILFYLVALALLMGTLTVIVNTIVGFTKVMTTITFSMLLFMIWISGRKVAQCYAVARYTKNWYWLSLSVILLVLLFMTFGATWYALVTPQKRTKTFKGPRYPIRVEN